MPFSARTLRIRLRRWIRGGYPANPRTVGERIRRARLDRGVTLGELARAVGRSRSAVVDWESDRRRPLGSSWRRLVAVLGPIQGWLPDGYGERLRVLRLRLGLTQVEFGRRLGLCEKTIENLEKEKKTPTERTIRKLAELPVAISGN